jgi:predicted HTH transcriptional regulator
MTIIVILRKSPQFFLTFAPIMRILTDTQYIHQLVAEGEHDHQDFKFEISDARKIARSISAFANTGGGRLLVGVKDNGKIAGVRSEEEIYMIEAAASMYCQPQVEITTHTHIVEGRTVLKIDIEEAGTKPVFALDEENKPKAYIRIADENILASPVHLKVWQHAKKERGALLTFTEKEQNLLDILKEHELLTLNQCCKRSRTSRQTTCNLLADFIRFGLVVSVFQGHQFYFKLIEED